MFYDKALLWLAERTFAFWLRVAASVLILSILITPTCMYLNVKEDLRQANSTIADYKKAAKEADAKEKEVIPKIEQKDKVIDRIIVKTKIKREYIYVNNKEAADWACTPVPDAVIGLPADYSEASGPGTPKARPLPDYCVLQGDSGKTSDK